MQHLDVSHSGRPHPSVRIPLCLLSTCIYYVQGSVGFTKLRYTQLVARPRLLAEVDDVVGEAEDHDRHAIDAEGEGEPFGDAALVAEQAEIELASA